MIEVNARRLLCPMPVIRLQDALEPLDDGAQVIITCTDPGVMNDIPAWCRINGHEIVSSEHDELEYTFTVRKVADSGY